MKLKVKDISKNYNRYSALRGVNLELEPGLYGLLGPNGAGKSTLLKIIAGILRPTAGSILLDNEPVSKLGEHYRAMLGYMPQDLGIYPEFTAKRYLLYIAALKGLTEAQAKAEIDKLLEAVGLSSNAEHMLFYWLSAVGTAVLACCCSALCKKSLIALIMSGVLYFLPYFPMKLGGVLGEWMFIFPIWSAKAQWVLRTAEHKLVNLLPLSCEMPVWIVIFTLIFTVVSFLITCKSFSEYQGT